MAPRPDWNLLMVRARDAWRLLPKRPDGSIDWGAIRVGHLDTGCTRHPIFGDWTAGSSWLRPADGLNLIENGKPPLDPLDYEGNPGHGTRTASLLCGDATRLGADPEGEIGIAPRLPVVPCRVVNSVVLIRERHRTAVADGIRHAMDAGCQVISMSLGTPTFPPNMTGGMGRAVDRAYDAGIIMAAAGGQVIDRVTYPAKYNRTIGCGGVTRQRRVWFPYALGDEAIDVWAPAEDVLRADALAEAGIVPLAPVEADDPGSLATDSGSRNDGKVGKGAGTSYATVHVAAAAAMWLRLKGAELDAAYPEPWQRVEAFRLLLKETAGPINGASPANGSGVLDIERLLRAPLPNRSKLARAARDKDKFA